MFNNPTSIFQPWHASHCNWAVQVISVCCFSTGVSASVLENCALSDPGAMKLVYVLGKSPCDLKTTMHQNAVPTTFHTQNLRHHIWKIISTTLQHIIVLQSRGESHKKLGKLQDRLVKYVFYCLWPSPSNWRTTIHYDIVLKIFHTWWHILCAVKVITAAFQCIGVVKLWGDCPSTYENCMVPGSESAT